MNEKSLEFLLESWGAAGGPDFCIRYQIRLFGDTWQVCEQLVLNSVMGVF